MGINSWLALNDEYRRFMTGCDRESAAKLSILFYWRDPCERLLSLDVVHRGEREGPLWPLEWARTCQGALWRILNSRRQRKFFQHFKLSNS